MSEYKPGYATALELVLDRVAAPGPKGQVVLSRLEGRIAAETVRAPEPFPARALSMLDGVAVAEGQAAADGETVRTGELLPDGAIDVIPSELLNAPAQGLEARGAGLRPSIVARGAEYDSGDPILEAGQLIDHRHVAQLALFGIDRAEVFRRPRIRVAVFDSAPYSEAVAAWTCGFVRSYYDVDLVAERIADLDGVRLLGEEADLGLLISDGAPGRYDQLKELDRGALEGYEPVFWKMGLSPPKHVGFGLLGDVPVLVFPDVFFKTVLSAMAFLPTVLAAWVGARPLTRPARWAELPEISYPYPCLVPLRFGEQRAGLEVAATPLRSSFSARWASAAEGYVILDRPPRDDDELDAVVLGQLVAER
jgi:molybdopterin molybdotransferase